MVLFDYGTRKVIRTWLVGLNLHANDMSRKQNDAVVSFLKSTEKKKGLLLEKMPGSAAEAKLMCTLVRNRAEPCGPPCPSEEEWGAYYASTGDVETAGDVDDVML